MSESENKGGISAASAEDDNHDIDYEALKALSALREKCPRFRILMIGKANAGKTTILQKMCNTTDAPIIHDQAGNIVDPSVIDPTDERGIHDINHELTFSSNPNFVFHDSRGFEANSTEEISSVRKFITERAASHELSSQLHAIWYCLPTDNHRPLSKAEMTFFETGTDTGNVPVIAIFTKFDGLETKEYAKLREEGKGIREARALAPALADKFFRESDYFLKKLEKVDHPPVKYLCLRDMQKKTSSCAGLTKCTIDALDSKTMKALFVTVQQNNIPLCAEYCIKESLMSKLTGISLKLVYLTESAMMNMALFVLVYHPHTWIGMSYEDPESTDRLRLYLNDYAPLLQPLLPLLAGLPTGFLPIVRVCTAMFILAQASYWQMQESSAMRCPEALKLAISNYKESGKLVEIREAVDIAFPFLRFRGIQEGKEEEATMKILEIVKRFVIVQGTTF